MQSFKPALSRLEKLRVILITADDEFLYNLELPSFSNPKDKISLESGWKALLNRSYNNNLILLKGQVAFLG